MEDMHAPMPIRPDAWWYQALVNGGASRRRHFRLLPCEAEQGDHAKHGGGGRVAHALGGATA
jgi:hypothetical protein